MSTTEVREIAKEYVAAGLSVIPLRLDGTKSPAVGGWKEFQLRISIEDEVDSWFSRPAGIAIVTGRISCGLEVIDFDQPEVFEPWRELTTGIVAHLPIVETASGGFHVFYRCREITGNMKLASWEAADCYSHRETKTRRGCHGNPVKGTRIETRGEGGYVVAVGSPLEVHESRRPYVQIAGPILPEIPAISPNARSALWRAAATFHCGKWESAAVAAAKREIKRQRWEAASLHRPSGEITPWDDFDRRAVWADILEPHGWTPAGESQWTRPGKRLGVSAAIGTNDRGEEILTVFSSNAAPLSPGSYGAFRAFSILNYGGDGSAAAKELVQRGYGSARQTAA